MSFLHMLPSHEAESQSFNYNFKDWPLRSITLFSGSLSLKCPYSDHPRATFSGS